MDFASFSSLRGVWRSDSPGGGGDPSPGGGVTVLERLAGLGGVLGPRWEWGGGGALRSIFLGGESRYRAGGLLSYLLR